MDKDSFFSTCEINTSKKILRQIKRNTKSSKIHTGSKFTSHTIKNGGLESSYVAFNKTTARTTTTERTIPGKIVEKTTEKITKTFYDE